MFASMPRHCGGNAINSSANPAIGQEARRPSEAARERISQVRGNPLFVCDWLRAVFIHYEVDAEALQREVSFELDLREGRAYVSLVAFTMRNMRPRFGGRLAAMLFKPIATHGFLNVRAYVKQGGEAGIYFLAEWLPNRLSVSLGPGIFGLPYRLGVLEYRHEHEKGKLEGAVSAPGSLQRLQYAAEINPREVFQPCEAGSLDEFLMERYTAFTARGDWRRKFRIWHPPWPQAAIEVEMRNDSLLVESWGWFRDARRAGANYSPGFTDVWMGRPQGVRG
jgi:uncharacterized protein YqjF (DUF2071 family)